MGKINTITKDYMSNPKYFADSFNYYLFEGKQIIKANDLQMLDPTEMAIIPREASDKTVEKIRDVLKQCILMADDWDAPRSLKEMFDTTDETILRFVEDYRVHLIVPKEIKDFSRFATDFGKAMRFIAISQDKDSLWKLQQDDQYKTVDTETVRLINVCTKGNLPIEQKEETNVCKGLEGIREDGKMEGKIEGIALTKKVYKLERNGKSAEEIAKECNIPVAEVEDILKE